MTDVSNAAAGLFFIL